MYRVRDILKEHDAKYLLAKNLRQAEHPSVVWGEISQFCYALMTP